MVSASWLRRKSSNRSACEPRAPRWTSEINKVRKGRSGLSSLIESLPMNAHLTDSHDRAMTTEAARGTAKMLVQQARESVPARVYPRIAALHDNQATPTIIPLRARVNHRQRLLKRHRSAFPRRHAPELCPKTGRSQNRGRRESRVLNAPAALRAKVIKHTSIVTTGSPKHPAFPAQWF